MLKKSDLIPRQRKETDYKTEVVAERREWLTEKTGAKLSHVASFSIDTEAVKRNVENLIGFSQVPLAIAGPIKVNGRYANGLFYVPFATTQGTLVDGYYRGMIVVTESGGAKTAVTKDQIDISPIFLYKSLEEVLNANSWIENNFQKIKKAAEKTTKYGKLLGIKPFILGRRIILNFSYFTADAMGLNMINIATEEACRYIAKETKPERFFLRCNLSSDKKPSFWNFINGYGKEVTAEATIPRKLVERYFRCTPEDMFSFWHGSVFGSLQAGMIGLNAHFANAITAIFIACGQDPAQVVNAAAGISITEVTKDGDFYVGVRIPNLVIGTIGGGTALPTQKECLEIMGCYGENKAKKFAEIIAATVLAGEISLAGVLASGEHAKADTALRVR